MFPAGVQGEAQLLLDDCFCYFCNVVSLLKVTEVIEHVKRSTCNFGYESFTLFDLILYKLRSYL